MRTVAKQAQSDVHADLGAAPSQQCALTGQIGAGLALGMAERRALRAQLMIEGVDVGVVLLADVARPRAQQGAGTRRGGRCCQRDATGLVVDPIGRAGRGRGDHRTVGFGDLIALLGATSLLHRLEHSRGRPAHRDEVRVLIVELVQLGKNGECHLKSFGVYAVPGVRAHNAVYRGSALGLSCRTCD